MQPAAAPVLANLGVLHKMLGRNEEALRFYEESVTIAKSSSVDMDVSVVGFVV